MLSTILLFSILFFQPPSGRYDDGRYIIIRPTVQRQGVHIVSGWRTLARRRMEHRQHMAYLRRKARREARWNYFTKLYPNCGA